MNKTNFCKYCKKETLFGHNYCEGDCIIKHAKQCGGKVYSPNGLPIRCINANGDMYEHEHGDHPSYMFPVEVEYTGNIDDVVEKDEEGNVIFSAEKENHALLWTDGNVVLTIYECCYSIWLLRDGKWLGGGYSKGYCLTKESIEKIKKAFKK